jgi:hypothetical protein
LLELKYEYAAPADERVTEVAPSSDPWRYLKCVLYTKTLLSSAKIPPATKINLTLLQITSRITSAVLNNGILYCQG